MLKPVHIPTINTDAERLARSSQGTSRDIEAVARAWDKDALVLPNMFKRGSITISTLKPLPPEAKKHIALAASVTTQIMYEVDGVEEDGPDDSHDKSDPWVKVGTTTIDGTLVDIANVLDVSSWPINWDRDAVAAIDMFMRAQEPWLVGGRHLVAQRSHVNEHAGTAIIHCDIVRRQSKIEAEGAAKQAEFDREVATMEARDYPHGLPRPPCPECGPHGNRGEVLLASSWAKCTTCAGGKSGDLWGEVKADKPPLRIWGVDVNANPSYEELRAAMSNHLKDFEIASGIRAPDGRSFMDARREALLVQLGQGFKVPTLAERTAELDNLRRHNDTTIAKWCGYFSAMVGEELDEMLAHVAGKVP